MNPELIGRIQPEFNIEEECVTGWLDFYIFNGDKWLPVRFIRRRYGDRDNPQLMLKACESELWGDFNNMFTKGEVLLTEIDMKTGLEVERKHKIFAVSKLPIEVYYTNGGGADE